MTLEEVEVCEWASSYCDTLHPVDEYVVPGHAHPDRRKRTDGTRPAKLCRFHGQAWPRVGESREDTRARTARARRILTTGGDYARRNKKRGKKTAFSGPIGITTTEKGVGS